MSKSRSAYSQKCNYLKQEAPLTESFNNCQNSQHTKNPRSSNSLSIITQVTLAEANLNVKPNARSLPENLGIFVKMWNEAFLLPMASTGNGMAVKIVIIHSWATKWGEVYRGPGRISEIKIFLYIF